jgi:HEAT repeat protein
MKALALLAMLLQAADLDALKAKFEAELGQPAVRRFPAVDAIGALRSDAASVFLEKAFDAEKDPQVRYQILKALETAATAPAWKKLSAVASSPVQPVHFRSLGLKALLDAKGPEGLALARQLTRDPGEIRLQAFAGLRRYPLKDTEGLWRAALDDSDTLVQGMAFAALAPLKDLKLEDRARKILIDPNAEPALKHGSVETLRHQGGAYNARILIASAAPPDPVLRRLIAEALAAFSDDKSAAEIYTALRDKEPGVRAVAARALGGLKHAKAADKLAEPLADRNAEVRAAALESVAERREKNAEQILLKEAQKSDEEAAAIAIGLLAGFPSDKTKQLLLKLADHYKPGVALPALEALGVIGTPEAFPAFEKALAHKEWPVRSAAIRALSKIRTREAVDLLVERMPKEDGRLFAEIGDALRGLTGKGIGYAPGAWKEWWTAHRDTFAFGAAADAVAAAGAGQTTYHGIPVSSNRVVFCTDISGSMSETADGKETRLDQAKKELSRVLGSLSKDAHCNLIFFDDRIEPWKTQLVPIKGNLPQALQLVASLQPRGTTNIFDTLFVALQHKEADTIYLLSDGEPTAGRIIGTDDLLREIRKINRLRQVAIHCISLGGSPFMKTLAEQNGGLYVEVK